MSILISPSLLIFLPQNGHSSSFTSMEFLLKQEKAHASDVNCVRWHPKVSGTDINLGIWVPRFLCTMVSQSEWKSKITILCFSKFSGKHQPVALSCTLLYCGMMDSSSSKISMEDSRTSWAENSSTSSTSTFTNLAEALLHCLECVWCSCAGGVPASFSWWWRDCEALEGQRVGELLPRDVTGPDLWGPS